MAYTQFTLAQLTAQISTLLQDTTNVYWPTTEIWYAIREAMYYWGALTSYWRDRGSFTTTSSTHFYDLSTQLPTLRARTFTVDAITRAVQFALFELSSGISGTGLTAQFTISQITTAVIAAASHSPPEVRGIPLRFPSRVRSYPSRPGHRDHLPCCMARHGKRDLDTSPP